MRIFVAVMLCGIGVAGAIAVSGHTASHRTDTWAPCLAKGYKPGGYGSSCFPPRRYLVSISTPSWVLPIGVLVGFVGAAGGLAVLAQGRATRLA